MSNVKKGSYSNTENEMQNLQYYEEALEGIEQSKMYERLVKRSVFFAVFMAISFVFIKGFAWWVTGSVAMLASITDSLLDLLASATTVFILRFALMPPDENHSFGHGKAESLAGLAQSAFIIGSALFLFLNGLERLNSPRVLQSADVGVWATIIVILLTLLLVSYQRYVIKKTDSPAIKVDCLHYKTDLYMNIAILISLETTMLGVNYADSLFAMGIAVYIFVSAAGMFYESIQLLLDRSLPENEIKIICEMAKNTQDSLGFHDLRTRRAGKTRFIQLHLEISAQLTLHDAHIIAQNLEDKLLIIFPDADVIIHQDPYSKSGHVH